MYVCVPYAYYLNRMLEPLKLAVTDSCVLPCRCWNLNLGSLEEQRTWVLHCGAISPALLACQHQGDQASW